jgi:hypothetical protein
MYSIDTATELAVARTAGGRPEDSMDEKSCESMHHWEHMCSLKQNSCEEEKLAQLMIDPMYECKRCGAKTKAPGNLCTPNIIGT